MRQELLSGRGPGNTQKIRKTPPRTQTPPIHAQKETSKTLCKCIPPYHRQVLRLMLSVLGITLA